MQIQYHRTYEKHGAVAPEEILDNDIWLDVGNSLRSGVFDHHQPGGQESAFTALIHYGHFLEKARAYVNTCRSRQEPPEIFLHVHSLPDVDSLAVMYAVEKMFERNAAGPADVFRRETLDVLLNYVNQIDNGKQKVLTDLTLYAYLISVASGMPDGQEKNEHICREGLHVLELVEKALDQNPMLDLFHAPIRTYVDTALLACYSTAEEKMKQQVIAYQKDKEENNLVFRMVRIFNRQKGQTELVKVGIWQRDPSGSNGYIYARDIDGCMVTVLPARLKEAPQNTGRRRIIFL